MQLPPHKHINLFFSLHSELGGSSSNSLLQKYSFQAAVAANLYLIKLHLLLKWKETEAKDNPS